MNVISFIRTVPQATPVTAPLQVIVELPGPYLMGLQIWTSDGLGVSNIHLRITEHGGRLIFPEPSANVLTPLTEIVDPKWYTPVGWEWVDLRLTVGNDPRYRLVMDLVNDSQAAGVVVVVNLRVAVDLPDQVILEMLRHLKQGIDRFPEVTESVTRKVLQQAEMERMA